LLSKFRRHESALLLALLGSENAIAPREPAVTRTNVLYLVIGALAVAVAVLSYQLYQDRHQPEGVHIELGPGGLSIQGNKSK
jgi:RsiW-degrading membrane proteinase PrsW (M82 family)